MKWNEDVAHPRRELLQRTWRSVQQGIRIEDGMECTEQSKHRARYYWHASLERQMKTNEEVQDDLFVAYAWCKKYESPIVVDMSSTTREQAITPRSSANVMEPYSSHYEYVIMSQ